jgi:hypothetical protein
VHSYHTRFDGLQNHHGQFNSDQMQHLSVHATQVCTNVDEFFVTLHVLELVFLRRPRL